MRVLVKTPISPYSGYGNDGIGLLTALTSAGLDVYLDPMAVVPPVPRQVAELLTKRIPAQVDLLIHHADPEQLGLTPEVRRAAKVAVAWTMWEYTTLDNCRGRSTLRRRLRDYDVVFGYDNVSAGALAPYFAPGPTVLQGGYWPDRWPAAARDWHSERFGFCMVGALHARKNPFAAIEAFRELKDEHPDFAPAELHLKTCTPGLHSAMESWLPGLFVHYDVWPDDVLRAFYADQHVLLAPSRGEGKNMPPLEMLSTGGTVIATNWGGHTQWLSPAYAYALDYELTPISKSAPNCQWAEPSKDHLKQLMLHTFRNRDEAKRKGQTGARTIPQMCSWPAVVRRMFDTLGLRPEGGHLLNAARLAALSIEANAKAAAHA